MNWLSFLIYTLLSAGFIFLQSSALPFLVSPGFIPDLAFILFVYFAFLKGALQGELLGFVLGLLLDVLTSAPFGFYSLSLSLLGYLIGKFKGMMQLNLIFIPLLIMFLASLSKWLLMLIIAFFLGFSDLLTNLFTLNMLIQNILTVLISPLIFFVLSFVNAHLNNRREYE